MPQENITVRVEPLAAEVVVQAGETLFAAATRLGFGWPTVCHGEGWCTSCHVEIVEGGTDLPSPSRFEEDALKNLSSTLRASGHIRLACQICPKSDLTVRKMGVVPPQH